MMSQWTLLLFTLYGVLNAIDSKSTTEQEECCDNGKDRAAVTGGCAFISLSPSPTCSFLQKQCCIAAVGDRLCDNGITMARGQGACERPFFEGQGWETKISKDCCDCCTFGLAMASHGVSCEFQGVILGGLCMNAAQKCCKNLTEEMEPSTNVTEKHDPVSPTVKPQEGLNDSCKDSKCSHLCGINDTCLCYDGYQLKKDGYNCEDINECLTHNHNCVDGEVCINTDGSFRCQRETSCGTGYELKDDNSCQDIDECSLGTHNCGPAFLCSNTEGSFRCQPKVSCSEGFIQDAVGACMDINECVAHPSPCQPGETCINREGSHICRKNTVTCGRGYHLSEDGSRCEDVDECRMSNVCGGHGCVNLLGSYRCECRVGFLFNTVSRLCEDIDECRQYSGQLCAHKCKNTEGSYQCSCTVGFKLSYDGRNCEDLNECEANPCSQECANVYGSFQCYCRHGYQLSDIDGITCEDIDECVLPNGGHVCSYQCSNTPGSFYCTCPPMGYTLSHNGRTCQDIDECAVGSHTCSSSESCVNVQGGYRCLSFACPYNFRPSAKGRDTSVSLHCVKACQPEDRGCQNDPIRLITHTSISVPSFRYLSEPEEIVFLRTMAAANPVPLLGAVDVLFEILTADNQFSFDVQKHSHNGMIMGVVRLVKPIMGPRDITLEVAMNYVKSGVITNSNIVVIHVFVSEFWF